MNRRQGDNYGAAAFGCATIKLCGDKALGQRGGAAVSFTAEEILPVLATGAPFARWGATSRLHVGRAAQLHCDLCASYDACILTPTAGFSG